MPKSGTSPEPPNDQISDSERTQSPGDLQAWQDLLAPAQGTKLSPAPAPHSMETPLGWEPHPCTPGFPQGHSTCTHKGCSMPGSPAALAEAVLRAQNTLATVQDTKLQQSTPRGQDHRMSDVTLLPGHSTDMGPSWRPKQLPLAAQQVPASEDVPENTSSGDINGYSSHPSLLSCHRVSPAPLPQH